MTAVLLLNQTGLPAGSNGFARTDGLNTGATVTISSVGVAQTHEARVLSFPETDTTTISTFVQNSTTEWEFDPTSGIDGMWRIELVTDRGTAAEDRQVRVFGIRDGNGYLFPSFGLVADPLANRPDLTDPAKLLEFIQANELNEPTALFTSGYPFGYFAELDAILRGAAGGGAPDILWEWNGADVSQFRQGATPELDTATGSLLSVVGTGQYGQTVLRVAAGGSAGDAQWVIDPATFPDGVPARHVLEVIYDEFDSGAGVKNPAGTYVGLSHFCLYNSPGNVRAWSYCQGAAINSHAQMFTRNTTFGIAGGTPPGFAPGTTGTRMANHKIQFIHQLGATYDAYLTGRYVNPTNGETLDRNNDGKQLDFDAGAYDTLTPNTYGIVGRFGAGSNRCDISAIRVRTHPADGGPVGVT